MSESALELIRENKRTQNPVLYLNFERLRVDMLREIENHTWLKELNLGSNQIQDIKFLANLHQLRSLTLSRNQIQDISFLENLSQLQSLYIGFNQIRDIRFLEKMNQLEFLDLSSNQIQDYSCLEKLSQLQFLNLSSNQIQDYNFLEKLTKLEFLNLGTNQIQGIRFLEKLSQLQFLDLSNNQIQDINFLQNLTELRTLYLNQNRIQDIKPLFPLIKKGLEVNLNEHGIGEIHLYKNPITSPPLEIIKQGKEAVINWFEALEQQGEEMVYEAKLMIIGDAGSGKTSLATKLKNLDAKLPDKITETTIGIEISPWSFEAKANKPHFKVNIWDLGGQKIYHPLHQLFFTQRSLYVLVSDGRNDTDENDLTDFWIPAQELLAKNSPMLILFNKHGNIQANMAFRNFQLKYPNIKGDLAVVDLLNERQNTADFIAEIEKYMRGLPQFVRGETLPRLWARIREVIHQREENYISLQEFRNICISKDLNEYEKQDFLSDYLHDLGIILRFRDDALLNKMIFLNPQWALDAIYKVLDHTREHNNGLFTKDELLSVWERPEFNDVQDELLALMLKFELCYKTSESMEQYLVPSLLSKDLPKGFEWDKEKSVCLYYEYDFMPKGIISRLIVRLNRLIDKESKFLWREGVIFEDKGRNVWLSRPNKNRIEIYAKGYKPSYLINLITDEIDEINSKYYFSERSKPRKYVPCICEACKNSKKLTFYDYGNLIERDSLNKKTIECGNPPYHEVNVKELLENVESKELSDLKPMKKIFVSYSKFDDVYKEEFKQHMVTLKRQGLAEIFDDRQIELGVQWDDILKQKIDECDYFVCLISRGFLNVDYIYEDEIPRAIKQGKRIIPVIIKPCEWMNTPIKGTNLTFGTLNAHNKGMAISLLEDYTNGRVAPREYTEIERDAMWVGVVNAIKGLIVKDK
ncbi:COR domain-containing protein [Emticicia fontis]